MEQLDYECGIDCPEGLDDSQMLMDYVIAGDCELCFLDAWLGDTLRQETPTA